MRTFTVVDGVTTGYTDDVNGDGKADTTYTITYDKQDRPVLTEGYDVKTKELAYRWLVTWTPIKDTTTERYFPHHR